MAEYQDDRTRYGSAADRLGEAGAPPGRYEGYAAASGTDDGHRAAHGDMRETAAGLADRAKQQGKAMAAQKKDAAAGQVDSAAQALHKTAEDLQGSQHPQAGHYVGFAAEQLERLGRRLRDTDIDGLIGDAEALGRRSPVAFFAGAVAVGFLASRFMKSSADRRHGRSVDVDLGSRRYHGMETGSNTTHEDLLDPSDVSMARSFEDTRPTPADLATAQAGSSHAASPFPTSDSVTARSYGDKP